MQYLASGCKCIKSDYVIYERRLNVFFEYVLDGDVVIVYNSSSYDE